MDFLDIEDKTFLIFGVAPTRVGLGALSLK